ncbi:penicillin-binding protein PBP2B [Streptococcus sp. H49]|uniref:penicillin-binding protein PBP2B n=1 Tax=Streptococcus huangxiaojuni TaxID=3237239 RepID=UPI0034A53FA1
MRLVKNNFKLKLHIVKRPASIPRRVNLLFGIIVLLFTIIIFRLAQMQIINKDFYTAKLTATTTYTVKTSSPRGSIYDATGRPLVENEVKEVVAFTRSNTVTAADIKALAQELANYVTLTQTNVSERAKKDYYLADSQTYQEVVDSLPDKKKNDNFGNSLTESEIYANAVDAVTDEQINYSEDELKIIYIFNQMNSASTFYTVNLKTGDLTEEQVAYLTANQANLPGITVTTDWTRRSIDTSLSDILGTVSSEETGLPEEEADAYLEKGYSLNDRVGTSYLEKQYEDDLQGKRTVRTIKVDKDGEILSDDITAEGTDGDNLKLTINLDFQEGVESILQQYFNSQLASGYAAYSDGMYAVALEPKTGKVLALAGLSHEVGSSTVEANNIGAINSVFTPGSVVKGATLSSGWENGVLSGNEVLYDQQIGSIRSWFTRGFTPISAAQALEYSSNTYMVQVALRLMGQEYTSADAMTTKGYKEAMAKLRATYAQYGMGTSTGLDLPESEGYLPDDFEMGNVLNEAFGQYDSYTTIQLAQYAATVANDGKRMAAHIVEGVYHNNESGDLGELVRTIESETLDTVGISSEEMAIIQQGFYNVVNSYSAYATGTDMASGITTISGKTGTAETSVTDSSGRSISTVNLNVVAYDADRSIAVAVVYPHASDDSVNAHKYAARDIINLYVSSYASSETDETDESSDETSQTE